MKEIYSVFNNSKTDIEKDRDVNLIYKNNSGTTNIEKYLQLILTMMYKITKNLSNKN